MVCVWVVVFYLQKGGLDLFVIEFQIGSQRGALITLDEGCPTPKFQNQWKLTRLKGAFYRNNHLEQMDQQLIGFGMS